MSRLVTATLPVTKLIKGMTIVEYKIPGAKPSRILVERVEHSACSSRGTHVNGSMCWGSHSSVQILTGTEKSPDEMSIKELAKYLGIPEDAITPQRPTDEEVHNFLQAIAVGIGDAGDLMLKP